MYKRLKYTKDIMTQMLSSNNGKGSPERATTVKSMAKTQTRFGAGLKS